MTEWPKAQIIYVKRDHRKYYALASAAKSFEEGE